jgi:hypothetical protein
LGKGPNTTKRLLNRSIPCIVRVEPNLLYR